MSVTLERDHDLETRREARFNCRTTPTNLLVLKKAASLAGLSVSQFVMNASLDAAYDLIQNRHHTLLSQQDWAVLTGIGENPPAPTEALQELAAQHRARMGKTR